MFDRLKEKMGLSNSAVTCPIQLKTVYDTTSEKEFRRKAAQLALHVASWNRHIKPMGAPLEVLCVGEPGRAVVELMTALGATFEVAPQRHDLFHRSPIYNKHLAAPPRDQTSRVFLSDNDTVFINDISPLTELAPNKLYAAMGGRQRVSPTLWQELIRDKNISVIEQDWIPSKEQIESITQSRSPVKERYFYFNGGVLLFPAGQAFWNLWEKNTRELSAYFEGRGLHDRRDAGSDQLSLTVSAASTGQWGILPGGFNFFPSGFWLNQIPEDGVRQIHMVGSGAAFRPLRGRDRQSLMALVNHYWERNMGAHIACCHAQTQDALQTYRRQILDLVADYDLDDMRRFTDRP